MVYFVIGSGGVKLFIIFMTAFSSVLSQKCVDGQKGSVSCRNALRNVRQK